MFFTNSIILLLNLFNSTEDLVGPGYSEIEFALNRLQNTLSIFKIYMFEEPISNSNVASFIDKMSDIKQNLNDLNKLVEKTKNEKNTKRFLINIQLINSLLFCSPEFNIFDKKNIYTYTGIFVFALLLSVCWCMMFPDKK
ncbi:hypothetical protein TUBRATIS_26440 [Tubulinosema ratisbonensis]|uniref:Uncharacterized protein n=1 Tax=Tubulinosema ratisbonensis TaxID=291195 RepID=A0A437AI98_9MICR|nr:hypothetical protein TUBRATIS_26440 [Tubulinosema ratisbonensis]